MPALVSLARRHTGNARACDAVITAPIGITTFREGKAAVLACSAKPLPLTSAGGSDADAAAAGVGGEADSRTCMEEQRLRAAASEADSRTYREELQREELAPLLVTAMQAHPADVGVAAAACGVVANIAHASPASDALLLRSRIPACITSALRLHARDANLAMRECAALRNLAMSKGNRAELLRAGAIRVVALVGAAPYHTGGVGSEDHVIPILLSALEMVTGYNDSEM